MDTPETAAIPLEIRACVEATAFFEALRRGDYSAAAIAQKRLQEYGWHITRERPKPARERGGGR
jgi:hypothetical protein